VEPAPLVVELLTDGIDEGGRVVMKRGLDLAHVLRIGRLRRGDVSARLQAESAQLGPGLQRRKLHLQPTRKLALVRQRAAMAGRE